MVAALAGIALLMLTSDIAAAASSACNGRQSALESMICTDKVLSELDDELTSLYSAKEALLPSSERPSWTAEQRDWLKQRNQCKDQKCLESTYLARIGDLLTPPVPDGIPVPSADAVRGAIPASVSAR